MNCPACGTAMTEVAVSDVKIQACKGGCGGLWFDERTLRKVDQPDQSSVANIFKFICPSYYIPGKQAWGAF